MRKITHLSRARRQEAHKRRHPNRHRPAQGRTPLYTPQADSKPTVAVVSYMPKPPAVKQPEPWQVIEAGTNPDLMRPIEELDLPVRTYNVLKREGIDTIGNLTARTADDLLDIHNFGQKGLRDVREKLNGMGLALKNETPVTTTHAA